MAVECYKCGHTLSLSQGGHVARNEECDKCYASIHCCRMCEFYDPNAYNECREPTADRILEKEKANFCDFFKLSDGMAGKSHTKQDLFSLADALFKK